MTKAKVTEPQAIDEEEEGAVRPDGRRKVIPFHNWGIAVIAIAVVIKVPADQLPAALPSLAGLVALLMGGGSTAVRYSNRLNRK
ncbi:hypothetical protein ACFRIC_39775 [Streptomyces sp. NPDC056738]|uniref:hypothetical protein n=1 Tax=Streptomyces sp. NPDC056738 TaxID=3345933 RepID=UPI003678F40A